MADGTIVINPGTGGPELDTTAVGTKHRERIVLAGSAAAALIEPANTQPAVGAYAVPTRDVNIDIALSVLRDAITKTGVTTNTLADVVAALQATLAVSGTVGISGTVPVSGTFWQATQPVSLAGTQPVRDDYQTGEILADQTGAAGVLTFTFSAPVQLVVVDANGTATDVARADPFGGTPAATTGIPCRDETPTYMAVQTSSVKVYAPSGMVISCYGYRRA